MERAKLEKLHPGYFPEPKSKTDIRKPSDSLFDAIQNFQRSSGLKVDGWMRPYGETERALDRKLAPMFRETTNSQTENAERDKPEGRREAAAVAIPWIVYQIAAFFSMSLMAAWAWWQSMSAAERDKVRRQVTGGGNDSDNSEADCDYLHYKVDIPRCNAIARRRGKQPRNVALQRPMSGTRHA